MRRVLARLLVRLAAPVRAVALLLELDHEESQRTFPDRGAAARWYRRECRSLARAYALQRLGFGPGRRATAVPRSMLGLLAGLGTDVRFALRGLRRSPGFGAAVVLVLGLGIGLNAAMVSLIEAVLVRPLPFSGSERLVRIWHAERDGPDRHLPATAADYRAIRDGSRALESVTGFSLVKRALDDDWGPPRTLTVARTAPSFLSTLAAPVARGRGYTALEERSGAAVVMLSHRLWQRRYGGNPAIVDATVRIDDVEYRVVGILPPTLDYPRDVDLWRPVAESEGDYDDDDRELTLIGRLRDGVSPVAASRELERIARGVDNGDGKTYEAWTQPLRATLTADVRMPLLALLGAVVVVLGIACANVAGLLLARSVDRRHETAVRAALGAGRSRLIRQHLVEGCVLAFLGSAFGVGLGRSLLALAASRLDAVLPRMAEVAMDDRALAFTALATIATGMVCGLAPMAGMSTRSSALAAGQGRAIAPREQLRAMRLLVVGEVALAVVLVTGAALLIRSFDRLLAVDRGFEPAGVLTVGIDIPDSLEDRDPVVFYETIRARVAAVPGVVRTALGRTHPLDPLGINLRVFDPRGLPDMSGRQAVVRMVTPGYFSTTGIPVLRGRAFTDEDRQDAPGVAIVSEGFARSAFGGADAVGESFEIPWRAAGTRFEIIGVVGDVVAEIGSEPRPAMYLAFEQIATHGMQLLVKTDADPAALTASVRDAIWEVAPTVPLDRVATLDALVREQAAATGFQSTVIGTFALLALLLSMVGLHGVVALGVASRGHEIGVRRAVGARAVTIRRMVLRESMRLAAIGGALGLAGAWGLARVIRGLLFDVAPTDALSTAFVLIVVATTTTLAAWLPAARAARIDPARALRAG